MALRLKTKIALTTALLVLGVAAVTSLLYVATVTREVVRDARNEATRIAQEVFFEARRALETAEAGGARPTSSDPTAVREFLRRILEEDPGLATVLEAMVSYSPTIYEVTIVDGSGTALISSDPTLPGRVVLPRTPLENLERSGFPAQLRELWYPLGAYQVSFPFDLGGKAFGEIRVAAQIGTLKQELKPALVATGLLGLAAVVLSTLAAALVSNLALAPVARISAQLDRIAAGEFDPVPLERSDELGQVSTKLSEIDRALREVRRSATREEESLERIGARLQVSERMAALSRTTGGVAHEIKKPLTALRLWLGEIKESLPPEQDGGQRAVQILDSEIVRLDRIVMRLLHFMRPVELHREELSLADVVAEMIEVARPQIERAGVEVKLELPHEALPVRVDRQLIKQALLNLVVNAIEAMPGGGKLSVVLARRDALAELTVTDTGCGIPREHHEKVFQLFFTTRPGGNGIGLAETFKAVQFHNGSIEFESEVGRGTTFRIELPLAEMGARATSR